MTFKDITDATFAASTRLAARVAELEAEVGRLRDERDYYATAALVSLSGLVGTPEKGYVKVGGPGLFRSDLMRLRRQYEDVLASRSALLSACRTVWESIGPSSAPLTDAAWQVRLVAALATMGEVIARVDGEGREAVDDVR